MEISTTDSALDDFQIDLEDKYTILFKAGTKLLQFEALRYGEKWRSLVGDKLILALCHRIVELEFALHEKRREDDDR